MKELLGFLNQYYHLTVVSKIFTKFILIHKFFEFFTIFFYYENLEPYGIYVYKEALAKGQYTNDLAIIHHVIMTWIEEVSGYPGVRLIVRNLKVRNHLCSELLFVQ